MNRKFTPKDSVIELVSENYNLLPVLSRFSMPLGFQNKLIGEVCEDNGIDVDVFLCVVNFILSGRLDVELISKISPLAVVDFLHNSHEYFLGYKFPHIRENLIGALDECHNDINPAIVLFFDNYIREVEKHFSYEEKKVFPYVRALIGGRNTKYRIDLFRRHHDEIGQKLAELKNIILRYYTTSMPNRMYDVLVDIYNAEEDLNVHRDIENDILIPMMIDIENKCIGEGNK